MIAIVFHHLWTVSWQVCVLAALALLAERVYRNAPPSFRYWLWMLVLARLCVPVEFSLPTGMQGYIREGAGQVMEHFRKHPEPAMILSGIPADRPVLPDTEYSPEPVLRPEPVPAPSPPKHTPVSAASVVFFAWAGIALLLLSIGLFRSILLRRQMERCAPVERHDLVALLDRLRRGMGIRRPVELRRLEGAGLNVPAVTGAFRPRLWLPPDIADSWATEEIEPILLHELAHVRRWDILINFLQGILQAVYFFHPAVWYANREIRRAREEICDDLALSRLDSGSRGYARILLRVVERASGSAPGLAALAITEHKSGAAARIRRILSARYRNVPRLTFRTAALVVLVGAAGLSLASPHSGGWGKTEAKPPESPEKRFAEINPFDFAEPLIQLEYRNENQVGGGIVQLGMEYYADPPNARNTGEAMEKESPDAVQDTVRNRNGRFSTRITPEKITASGNTLDLKLTPGTTIRPGSDRVIANGDTLTRDLNYHIDYTLGRITLLNPPISSKANIEVNYEEATAPSGKASTDPGEQEMAAGAPPAREEKKPTLPVRLSRPVSGYLLLPKGSVIMAGSERVTLNGKSLVRGRDYEIDHMQGQIQLPDQNGLLPSSSLDVYYVALPSDYASADFTLRPEKGNPELRWQYIHLAVRERQSIATSPASPEVIYSYKGAGVIRASEAATARPWEKTKDLETALDEESFKAILRSLTRDHDSSQATIDRFQEFINRNPKSIHVPEAKFHIAFCRYTMHQFRDALLLFDSFAYRYPNHAFVPDALFYLADSNYNLGNFEEAVKGFDAVISQYPKSGKADEALFTKAWALLDLHKSDQAIKAFEQLVKDYPGSRFAADAKRNIQKSSDSIARSGYSAAAAVFKEAKEKNDPVLYRKAGEMFVKLLEAYPEAESAASAYESAVQCYEALGESKRIIELNRKYQNKFGRPGAVLPPMRDIPPYPPKK